MAGWVHMNTTAKYVKIELNAYFRCAESPWLLQSWTQRHIAWHRKTFDHTFLMRSPNGKLMDAHIFNFPSKTSIYNGFSIAMLNNQMLFPKLSQQVTTSHNCGGVEFAMLVSWDVRDMRATRPWMPSLSRAISSVAEVKVALHVAFFTSKKWNPLHLAIFSGFQRSALDNLRTSTVPQVKESKVVASTKVVQWNEIPFGKRLHNYGKITMLLMGKSTI